MDRPTSPWRSSEKSQVSGRGSKVLREGAEKEGSKILRNLRKINFFHDKADPI